MGLTMFYRLTKIHLCTVIRPQVICTVPVGLAGTESVPSDLGHVEVRGQVNLHDGHKLV